MDEDLDTGGTAVNGNDSPSLIDTLSESLGLEDEPTPGAAAGADGETAGDTTADPVTATGAAPSGEPTPTVAGATPPADPAKPEDPNAALHAPLPEHNPRKTHERFQKLVEGHKEEITKREAAEAEREQLRGQIQQYEAGLQPLREMGFTDQAAVEDLRQFSQFRRALASGDTQAALRVIQPILTELQLKAGGALNIDPLADFPEIAQRVRVGEIDYATALELARGRHGQQVQQQRTQQTQQQEQQHAQQMEEIRAGAAAVSAVDAKLKADPDYQAVAPALMKQLDYIKTNFLPHQWAGQVERTYHYEKQLMVAQARSAAAARPAQQPLRASGHSGGAPVPSNVGDAAAQALGF